MKVFVTGGPGFIGRHLCRALLKVGHQVTVAGRLLDPAGLPDHPGFTHLDASDACIDIVPP